MSRQECSKKSRAVEKSSRKATAEEVAESGQQ